MRKKAIAVLFGGQSSEHEVSCISAATVIRNINPDNYEIHLVGITEDGKWVLAKDLEDLTSGNWKNSQVSAVISPDATHHGLLVTDGDGTRVIYLDVVFPVLHGLYGEDGTVQGILELARIPYVGCGVLASAVSMDKYYTKMIVERLGIRQADYVAVRSSELSEMDAVVSRIESKFSYPVYIKPCNAGSSKGVSRAADRASLVEGLLEAAKHDRKMLVEETIIGREVECAVLGGREVRASGVGEVLAASDVAFYDFEAKYYNPESKTVLDPDLPGDATERIRKNAVEIFKAVDGYGLSRVDFFVTKDAGEVVFNEINTLPGFTAISMYPSLWENRGIGKQQLVEKLIQSALVRWED
ncbi:MAG: D-alanine--D-alanine ligase [Lachnospiraceae bacterium]|nr:D-alanine--D-alanine ligase [Lachnospiraceae bacterium]